MVSQRLTFKTTEIYTPEDLVRIYNYYDMGHFFDKDTMKFFGSKLTSMFGSKGGEFYFVTSERDAFVNGKRAWTLRKAFLSENKKRIDIDSVSEFCGFATAYQANKALLNTLKGI